MAINVSDVVVHTATGSEQRLGELDGQVRLIVNVASRCGFTRQYAGLQALQESYGAQGFSVIARFKSGIEPESAELKSAIEAALAA